MARATFFSQKTQKTVEQLTENEMNLVLRKTFAVDRRIAKFGLVAGPRNSSLNQSNWKELWQEAIVDIRYGQRIWCKENKQTSPPIGGAG